MDIEKAIRRALLEKDIQQQDLADMVGYSKNGFNAYLRKRRFYMHDIIRMSDALGYDVRLQLIDRETGKVIDVE